LLDETYGRSQIEMTAWRAWVPPLRLGATARPRQSAALVFPPAAQHPLEGRAAVASAGTSPQANCAFGGTRFVASVGLW